MYSKEIKPLKGLKAGYLIFRDITHPLSYASDGSVYLHRHIASIKYGRWLNSDEHVHHIDENKLNNCEDNLVVLSSSEHAKIHNPESLEASNGRINTSSVCQFCTKEFFPLKSSLLKKFCSHDCFFANAVKNKELTKEILDELIPKMSWVALGKMFGYSDNGIKKRAKALGCIIPKRRYNIK